MFNAIRGETAKRELRERVEQGAVHALFALNGDEPVGWVCLGPPVDFPRLETVRALRHELAPNTWAIVCLFLRPNARRKGLGTLLIGAARDYAFKHGARVVEGYPVNVRADSTIVGAFAWTGVPAMFEGAGFTHLERGEEARGIWFARKMSR